VTIHGPEGEPIVPAFTDPGALLLWAPGGNDYETLKAQSLFELALDNDVHSILVNPAGPTGGQITRAEMVVLAQGVIPEGFGQGVPTPWSYAEGSQVLIAAPANLPSEGFFALLREAMEHFPAITEGYLALTIWGGGEPHLTVGVGLSSPADEQIVKAMFSALTRAVQPALPENRHVNFLVLGDDEIAEAIRNLQIVVFRRD